ncbi:putative aquaporin 1 [Filobasidium floriforme]|uniref:putative aquaporin 1 n=1 Tax=Filobasidium floriforme TaxID=5210 RepID=UPI001E8E397A|nr:putative aquaporin 1 [Filobasidium floriforme]KAH8088404.1 putative aquaporin 1 [Filobasidium floriforme]
MVFKHHPDGMFGNIRNDLHAMYGEFVGTVLFLLFALGGVQATVTNLSINNDSDGTTLQGSDAARLMGLFYISASFGFSLFAIAAIFYRFTGSIFNPNVSFALLLCGVITPVRFVLVCIAQFVGSIAASAILHGLTPGGLSVNVALGFGTNKAQGLFIEMFITSALVLTVLMLAAEKSRFTPFAPLGFGFTLFVLELFAVEYTGGAVNTARAFGPACIQGFASYHWIYWVGPTLGSLLATAFWYILKHIKYWEINPGQDSVDYKDNVHHNDAPLSDLVGRGRDRNSTGADGARDSQQNLNRNSSIV